MRFEIYHKLIDIGSIVLRGCVVVVVVGRIYTACTCGT